MKHQVKLMRIASLCLAFMLTSSAVQALVFNITANNEGGRAAGKMVGSDGSLIDPTPGSRDALGSSSNGTNYDVIYTFKMPDLQGETITSIDFSFYVGKLEGTMGNLGTANLVGLRFSPDKTINSNDYGASEVMIQDDILDNSVTTGSKTLGDNAALRTWLMGSYKAGDYVMLAFQMDSPPSSSSTRYRLSNDAYAPVLTINTVPEPATYALIFGGLSLAFVMLRRRAKG